VKGIKSKSLVFLPNLQAFTRTENLSVAGKLEYVAVIPLVIGELHMTVFGMKKSSLQGFLIL
jgi:hypothetical protein